jgi:membrane-associated HD superfamily phosphohydrolase
MSQKTNNLTKTVTIIVTFLILISMLYQSTQKQQGQIAEAHTSTPAELAEQAKTAKNKALKQAEAEDNKAKAYELLNKAQEIETSLSSSESPKVSR